VVVQVEVFLQTAQQELVEAEQLILLVQSTLVAAVVVELAVIQVVQAVQVL
jgi:predicted translin family RNA/ssDNA-binding protein